MPAIDDGSIHSPLPYLADARLEIWVRGRWRKGGVIEFYIDGLFVDMVDLPPAKWCLVALLIESAMASASGSWAKAFRSATELSRELTKRAGRGTAARGNMSKAIHKLRSLLGASSARKYHPGAALSPLAFGGTLIEHHHLGYRISLPPANLHLDIVDEPAAPIDPNG